MDNEQQEAFRQQQFEALKKQLLGRILTREAFERLGRVRMVNPELAGGVELYLLQLSQAGKLPEPVTDGKLKEVLAILSEKRDITIKRR